MMDGSSMLPRLVEDNLSCICEEAITNAIKHAQPKQRRCACDSIRPKCSYRSGTMAVDLIRMGRMPANPGILDWWACANA